MYDLGNQAAQANGFDLNDMSDEIERIAKKIRAGKRPLSDKDLLTGTASQFIDDMAAGFGKSVAEVAWNAPDAGMIADLHRNVYQFSAAKNYHQLRDMTLALMDGDKLRSESDYLEVVNGMNRKYNRAWLMTERNNAIGAAQMASRWNAYEQEAQGFPILEYRTVGDPNVRPEHAALNGIRKRIDDPFWNTFYPPNGWGCRCDVIQVPDENATITPDRKIVPPSIPTMFKTNMAKSGMIFPKEHPYYIDIPHDVISKAIYNIPVESGYITYRADNNMPIECHIMHGVRERIPNLETANDLSKLGYKDIKLLPDINEGDIKLRSKFMPDKYKPYDNRKNPDAWIKDAAGNDMVCDFKRLTSYGNFKRRIKEASMQSNYAIIKLTFDHYEPHKLHYDASMELGKRSNLKGVIVIGRDGEIILDLHK